MGNGQVQPAKLVLRSPQRGHHSFACSSSAPCSGWTVVWWRTDVFWSLQGGLGIASSQEPSSSVVATLFQRRRVLAVILFPLFEGGSLRFGSSVLVSLHLLLVLRRSCARNTRVALMLVTTGCFCERLQLCAPQFKCFKLLYNNCQLQLLPTKLKWCVLICGTVNIFIDMLPSLPY